MNVFFLSLNEAKTENPELPIYPGATDWIQLLNFSCLGLVRNSSQGRNSRLHLSIFQVCLLQSKEPKILCGSFAFSGVGCSVLTVEIISMCFRVPKYFIKNSIR